MAKEVSEFKLVGLSKPHSFTCYTNDNKENIFWSSSTVISREKFAELFNWAKGTDGFWSSKNWRVEIEHDGLYNDGTPKEPNVLSIKEL